jgi:hypothetical protein
MAEWGELFGISRQMVFMYEKKRLGNSYHALMEMLDKFTSDNQITDRETFIDSLPDFDKKARNPILKIMSEL